MIQEDKSVLEIEMSIREELKNCSYWGELPVSRAQYEHLCNRLLERKPDESVPAQLDNLFKLYPACMVTTMVFFVIFEYRDEFWNLWGKKLGFEFSANHTGVAGSRMIETLKQFNMTSYEEDGYKYITPILCQAGVPDSNLDDLFYAITTSQRFDAHELISEFKGWRQYQIKKQLERFIRLHEDNALNLVVLVHDVMLDADAEINDTYEGRIFAQYDEWKKENLNRKGTFKGKGAYQENPHLIIDEAKGLCMVLPEYILEDEYCDCIRWTITDEECELFELECDVFNDGNSKHSLKKIVPVSAKQKYIINIYDAEGIEGNKLLRDWEVDGLSEQKYLLFDNNGKKRNDELFTYEGGTLIVDEGISNVEFNEAFQSEVVMPNGDGIKSYTFIPEKSNSSISIENDFGTILRLKKNIKAELVNGNHLFGDEESGISYPIFTSAPTVLIELEDGEIDHTISMVLRNRDTGYKKTVDIDSVSGVVVQEEKALFDVLEAFGADQEDYGRYSIKFYVKGLYKKELEFAYIPFIPYNEEIESLWPNEKGTFLTTGFRYKIPKGVTIEFTSKVNETTEKYKDDFWHLVKFREPLEFIEGEIRIGSKIENQEDIEIKPLVIPFRKRVRNLQWSLWKEEDIEIEPSICMQRLDIKQLENMGWWMALSMKKPCNDEECYLVLESVTGEEYQSVRIRPNDKGKWHFGIGGFAASIDGKRLPLYVKIKKNSSGVISKVSVLEIYENIILKDLATKYANIKNENGEKVYTQTLKWRPSNIDFDNNTLVIKSFADFDMEDIRITGIRKAKTKSGETIHFMAFQNELPAGLYKIAFGEEDYFDFGEEGFEPPFLTLENTFVVKPNELLNRIHEGTLSGLLASTMAAYKNEDLLESFVDYLRCHKASGELTENELRGMIVIVRYALNGKPGKCEECILTILKTISENMSGTDRTKLLSTIIDAEMKDEVKKKLIEFFELEYVSTSKTTQEHIDTIMSIDTFLGIRSMLKCDRSNKVLNSLASSLGFDIMKEMMKKDENGKTTIEATYEMFGDTEYFYNMFDWESVLKMKNYKPPKLDTKKKPEDELIFWGVGFIELLIKWYSRGQGRHPELEKETAKLAPEIERISGGVEKISDDAVKDYFRKTIGRVPQNNGGFYPLIASSVKAGMLFALNDFGKVKIPNDGLNTLMKFIKNMNTVFPELIKRDILMAELFLYLKEV